MTDGRIRTSIEGEQDLPRFFAAAFAQGKRIDHGRLDITLPDGRVFRVEGEKPGAVAELHVHNDDVFARLVRDGDLGFSDAYLEGWWSTPDLMSFMDFVSNGNDAVYNGFPGMGLVRAYERFRFWLHSNSKTQARKNISHHYDLGNEFYALWLDETMTYSSALFETGQESLERAQTAKYASMVDQLAVEHGDHVLEIGCGWGGFAEYAAAERGLRVTGLTISQAQHDYAVDRIAKAGLSDRVEIRLQDYRDERGSYDGIASIEMFEAVGEKYWPAYFDTVRACLKPGRRATLQIITVDDSRWDRYRKGVDFIQKHIFPGGMLPAPKILDVQIARAGLSFAGRKSFGPDYSTTLKRWHETFHDRWSEVAEMGFDARFKRMWDFYLCSCAAAFSTGICDVSQFTVSRPA